MQSTSINTYTNTYDKIYCKHIKRKSIVRVLLHSKLFKQRVAGLILLFSGIIMIIIEHDVTALICLSPFVLAALFSKSYIFYE